LLLALLEKDPKKRISLEAAERVLNGVGGSWKELASK